MRIAAGNILNLPSISSRKLQVLRPLPPIGVPGGGSRPHVTTFFEATSRRGHFFVFPQSPGTSVRHRYPTIFIGLISR